MNNEHDFFISSTDDYTVRIHFYLTSTFVSLNHSTFYASCLRDMKHFHNFVFYFTLMILHFKFFLKAGENKLYTEVAGDDTFCAAALL